jgi:hypothetical protein
LDVNNFQRLGSLSNAHAGNEFETVARSFFAQQGISGSERFPGACRCGRPKENAPLLISGARAHLWLSSANLTLGLKAAIRRAQK